MRYFLVFFVPFFSLAAVSQVQQFGGCVVGFEIGNEVAVCSSLNIYNLPPGSPAGGTVSGNGVFDGFFFPSLAGPGQHILTYSYDDGSCIGSDSDTITVVQPENIELSGDFEICMGDTTVITALTGENVEWSTNDEGPSVTLDPGTSTVYAVYAYDSNNCLASNEFSIVVHDLPVLLINGNTDVCVNEATLLTATGAASYNWSSGEDFETIEVFPLADSTVCVTGIDTNGCVGSTCVDIILHQPPVISILGNDTICNGETTMLTATGGFQYLWSTGSFASTISYAPQLTSVIAVDGEDEYGCNGTDMLEIVVLESPEIFVTGDTQFCSGDSTTLTVSGADSYLWSDESTDTTALFHPTTTTEVSITGTNLLGCQDTEEILLTVFEIPVLTIFGDTLLCAGDSTTLVASGGTAYLWNDTETGDTLLFIAVADTVISLLGWSNEGCGSETTFQIEVIALPEILVSGTTDVCAGELVTLEASGAESYEWNDGSADSVVAFILLNDSVVSVTGFANGCSAWTMVALHLTNPEITITGDTTVCSGESTTLFASGGSLYEWSSGSEESSITLTPVENEVVNLYGEDESGCGSTTSVLIVVNPSPFVEFNPLPETVCDLLVPVPLEVSPEGGEFEGNGISGNEFIPSADLWGSQEITYTYTNEFGCSDAQTQFIFVDDCSFIDENNESLLHVYPNPATDILFVRAVKGGTGDIAIYDQEGRMVKQQNSTGASMEVNTSDLRAGIYMIVVHFEGGAISRTLFEKF